MNILYLANHLNIGGISSYILSLSAGLKAKGHNVYVAASGGEVEERLKETGTVFIPIPIKTKAEVHPKILISSFKLAKYIREKNIDIIHANTRVTQVLARLIQKRTHQPFVSTCHGFFKKRLLRRIFPCWGLKVIAISAQVKEHLVKDFRVKEEDIRVIHHGIDIERFSRATNDRRRLTKENFSLGDGPVLGIIARLSDVKGHIYLIQAMQTVLKKVPNAKLLIVGEGKMQQELLNLTKELRIEENVKFVPSAINTQDALSIMDLFVMPSLKEGLGLSLMEAMAAGLAVIGTRVGGIKSLIQDGIGGLLVEPADVRGLSNAILELLGDQEKRESLGRNAQIFITQNFSLEKMVAETERVYRECLNEKV